MSVKILRPDAADLSAYRWPESSRAGNAPASVGDAVSAFATPASGENARSSMAPQAFTAMLEQAQQEALVARQQLKSQTKNAYQKGFDEGLAQASQQQRASIEAAQAELAESLGSLVRARQQVLAKTDLDLVHVAMAIAEKVLNRQLQIDQDALRGVARAALERLSGKPVLAIRAHPQDQEALSRALPELEAKGLRWLSDDALARGSIQFETEFGVLDASIHTQLEEIEHGLVDHLQRSKR